MWKWLRQNQNKLRAVQPELSAKKGWNAPLGWGGNEDNNNLFWMNHFTIRRGPRDRLRRCLVFRSGPVPTQNQSYNCIFFIFYDQIDKYFQTELVLKCSRAFINDGGYKLYFFFFFFFASACRLSLPANICRVQTEVFQNVWCVTWMTFLGIRVSDVWWWKHSDNGYFPPHLTAKALSFAFLTFSPSKDGLHSSVDI